MKIRPVILCGGAGTRLWPNLKKNQAKQFIDFGGWTLFGKTLKRIKGCLSGISFINADASIAGPVFFFEGSNIIL